MALEKKEKINTYNIKLQKKMHLQLTSSKSSNHDDTGTETQEETLETELTGQRNDTRGERFTSNTLLLVNLGQQGISRLRDNGSNGTGNNTSTEIDSGQSRGSELVLGGTNLLQDQFTIKK
jgi:hypothetical protein